MYLNQGFKGDNAWWKYLIGIIIVFIGYFVGQFPLYVVLMTMFSNDKDLGTDELKSFESNMDFEALGIDKNLGFILLILMFVGALIALWVVIKYLHQKRMVDLVTAQKPIQYHKIFFGFGLWMILTLILEGGNYLLDPSNYTFRWAGGNYFILLLISILFLPIQTSFEELFFRGYIMQGLAFLTKHKWVAILGSSIFFGLVHGTNPEVEEYGFWTMQSYYVVAGLFLALITVLDDGLELALGVHAATNIGGATLFTYKGSVLQTDSLFITEEVKPLLMLAGFILASIIFITICYMKYQWPSWRSLNEPILNLDSSKDEISAIGQDHDL
jgi:membrane protease YdiL (CAAX protease family)